MTSVLLQAEKLKRWATDEFHRPLYNLPSDHHFRQLCAGPWRDVWLYLADHVFRQSCVEPWCCPDPDLHVLDAPEFTKSAITSPLKATRNVKIIRGNLRWYQVRLHKEAQQKLEDDQRDSVKRRELCKKIKLLRTEITLLDSRIQEPEYMVARQVQSLQSTWANMKEHKVKEMLLKAFWQRSLFCHKMLTDHTEKISEECDTLELMTRCASVEVLFYLELFDHQYMESKGKGMLEPQVLREVRKLCDGFLQNSNQNHLQSKISAARRNDWQQAVVWNKWVNDVQNLWGDYPPSHVLAALRQLALREQCHLEQIKASLDQKTGSTAQRPHIKGDHTLDVSTQKENDLPPVKTLLEDAWMQVEKIWVDLARTRSRLQTLRKQFEFCEKEAQKKMSDKFPDDSSALLVLRMPLQHVMHEETRNHIKKRCTELKQRVQCEAQRGLQMKRHSVVTFRKQLIDKRKKIKDLNKKNSMARMQIVCFHSELQELIQKRLVLLIEDTVTAARFLENSVFKEARQLQRVSLPSLDCRNVEGEQRIPASQLSIHRLQSQVFSRLCQELKFPLYKAPGELWARSRSKQHELRCLHWIVQHYNDDLQKIMENAKWLDSSDENDFLSEMREEDSKRMKSLVQKARNLSHLRDKILSLEWRVKSATTLWWNQPAQYARPRDSQRGATYVQWLQRWKLAVLQL